MCIYIYFFLKDRYFGDKEYLQCVQFFPQYTLFMAFLKTPLFVVPLTWWCNVHGHTRTSSQARTGLPCDFMVVWPSLGIFQLCNNCMGQPSCGMTCPSCRETHGYLKDYGRSPLALGNVPACLSSVGQGKKVGLPEPSGEGCTSRQVVRLRPTPTPHSEPM